MLIIFLCNRYLLKREQSELTVGEVDAVLAMVTSNVLFDVQTMQDMQVCSSRLGSLIKYLMNWHVIVVQPPLKYSIKTAQLVNFSIMSFSKFLLADFI